MYTVLVSSRIQILEIAAIGGIIGFCVILTLLISLICYRTVRTNFQCDTPIMYWLSIIYLSSALIICFLTGFVRSNMVFGTSAEVFSSECGIGYIGTLLCVTVNRATLYLIFLHRMRLLFDFSGIYYLFFYWCISILTALNWCLFVLSEDTSNWLLISNDTKSSIFCVRDSGHSTNGLYIAQMILVVIEIVVFRVYVLLVFVNGLYTAEKQLKSVDEEDISMDSTQVHNVLSHLHRQKNITMKVVVILSFSVMASMAYWLCSAVVRDGSTWVCWEMMINAICVLLLLDGFDHVWKCCNKYGCCCCCFLSRNVNDYMMQSIGLSEHEKNIQYYSP